MKQIDIIKADTQLSLACMKPPFHSWKKYYVKEHAKHTIDKKVINYFHSKQKKRVYSHWSSNYAYSNKCTKAARYLTQKYSIAKYYHMWKSKFTLNNTLKSVEDIASSKIVGIRKHRIFQYLKSYTENSLNRKSANSTALQERRWWLSSIAFQKWKSTAPRLKAANALKLRFGSLHSHTSKSKVLKAFKLYTAKANQLKIIVDKVNKHKRSRKLKKYVLIWKHDYNIMYACRQLLNLHANHKYHQCFTKLQQYIPYSKMQEDNAGKKHIYLTIKKYFKHLKMYKQRKAGYKLRESQIRNKQCHNIVQRSLNAWKQEFEFCSRAYLMFSFSIIKLKSIIQSKYYAIWKSYHHSQLNKSKANKHYKAITLLKYITSLYSICHKRRSDYNAMVQLRNKLYNNNKTNLIRYWNYKAQNKKLHHSILLRTTASRNAKVKKSILNSLKKRMSLVTKLNELYDQVHSLRDNYLRQGVMETWKNCSGLTIKKYSKFKKILVLVQHYIKRISLTKFRQGITYKANMLGTVNHFITSVAPQSKLVSAFQFIKNWAQQTKITRECADKLTMNCHYNSQLRHFTYWAELYKANAQQREMRAEKSAITYRENLKIKALCSIIHYHKNKSIKIKQQSDAISFHEYRLLSMSLKGWFITSNNNKIAKKERENAHNEEMSAMAEELRIRTLQTKAINCLKIMMQYKNKKLADIAMGDKLKENRYNNK